MRFEVNGNLSKEDNFSLFMNYVTQTFGYFLETFGLDVMGKYELYIDNATAHSGPVPITTVVFGKFIIIKLGIKNFYSIEQIVFQFAHELCHYVFYSLMGLEKKLADNEEENICTAMSLIVVKHFFPKGIDIHIKYVRNLKEEQYKYGADIAEEVNFDIKKLKNKIYDYCCTSTAIK